LDPPALRVLEVAGVALVVGILTWALMKQGAEVASLFPGLAAWACVVVAADLMPVPIWRSVQLTISFPVLLAAAFVYPPHLAGVLSFVASVDAREFRREIPLMRGLLNRSNVALSVMAASALFHAIGGDLKKWPDVLISATPALAADFGINVSLVLLGSHLLTRMPFRDLLHNWLGGAELKPFLIAYTCFGLLALLMATVFQVAGGWGLISFAIPLLLARQTFLHWKRLGQAHEEIESRKQVLSVVTHRMVDERREERMTIAAGIHDDVLPPLFKVHLLGEVIRRDLAAGRLLDLEADVPDLLRAVETADAALRDLIHDLRQSTLGSGGLLETLRMLADEAESSTTVRVVTDLHAVGGSPLTHLLIYQVAREAVTNALKHSGAATIHITLLQEDGAVRLRVSDDGCGFDPRALPRSKHFGMELMRERVELAGGALAIDSSPGIGTSIVVRLPADSET
jgi:signal transduction histidine kinase